MQSHSFPLYEPLLNSTSKQPPSIPSTQVAEDGVIDEASFLAIEVEKLFQAVDYTNTRIGRATLYRSLARPLSEFEKIKAKQEALTEIEENLDLRIALKKLIDNAKKREEEFYNLLFATFLGAIGNPANPLEIVGFGYESYLEGTRFMLGLTADAKSTPVPKSIYLHNLLQDLIDFEGSRSYVLMKGPAFRSEQKILTAQEKRWYIPAVKFIPSMFKPFLLSISILLVLLVMNFAPFLLDLAATVSPVLWLFMLPVGLVYIPIVGGFDRDACIYPLRDIFKNSPEVQKVLDGLGGIDELFSFLHFKEEFGHPITLPDLVESEQHFFSYNGVRNPILAKENREYVENDLTLKEERLAFVTGPNSGGKTAFCKTLAQGQLLAQIGCYVPAIHSEIAVADRIFYQTPEISHLEDGEGRFGTELKRTKNIFMSSSSRSLVIMDELSEGTTHEEKIEISTDILNGFLQKGASTLLITHNHELVDHFMNKKIGLAIQAEFRNENPTYRLVEGISRVSHADRVARKIGFSREDIERMLQNETK